MKGRISFRHTASEFEFEELADAAAFFLLLEKAVFLDWEYNDGEQKYVQRPLEVTLKSGQFEYLTADEYKALQQARLAAKEAEAVLTANPHYGDLSSEELNADADAQLAEDIAAEQTQRLQGANGYTPVCEGRR